MAWQVRRAAALIAELAVQSEKKVFVVCDQLPGLRDELAEHIEAPNMEAGGSYPQATMMLEDSAAPAATNRPFATPAAMSLLAPTQSLRPAGKGLLKP